MPTVLLVGLSAVSAVDRQTDGCTGGAEVVLRPTAADVPDLVGLDEDAARTAAEGAGVPWQEREVAYRVGDAPAGTVLSQRGGACADPLRLLLSTGGPLVDPAEQAPAARGALGPDPGRVRAVRVGGGVALQSDDVVAGECPAVQALLAEGRVADGVVISCHPSPVDALADAVTAGSGFLGADEPVRVLASLSGAWTTTSGQGLTADRSGDGWRLVVLLATDRAATAPRCGPASAYEVCAVRERPDGATVLTNQVLSEQPLGSTSISLGATVHGGGWSARVLLAPDLDGDVRPERATAPPADLEDLVALADDARLAVAPLVATGP